MLRGTVLIPRHGSRMGPALASSPVRLLGPGGAPGTLRVACAAGIAADLPRADLEPARLWVARGRSWRGPFRRWRDLAGPLTAWDPDAAPEILSALSRGRGNPLGAVQMAGGWRYRMAWAGVFPPARYQVESV